MSEVIKDIARQERLNQVYRHLFAHFGISSQTEFADALHIQRTALSAAMNGNKAYLTNNLFNKICAAFPGVFNLDYLINGTGNLLTTAENIKSEEYESHSSNIDHSSLVNALLAAKDETIASLREQLQQKDALIHSKEEIITLLRRQIAQLNQSHDEEVIRNYPFGIGVAESSTPEQNNV